MKIKIYIVSRKHRDGSPMLGSEFPWQDDDIYYKKELAEKVAENKGKAYKVFEFLMEQSIESGSGNG